MAGSLGLAPVIAAPAACCQGVGCVRRLPRPRLAWGSRHEPATHPRTAVVRRAVKGGKRRNKEEDYEIVEEIVYVTDDEAAQDAEEDAAEPIEVTTATSSSRGRRGADAEDEEQAYQSSASRGRSRAAREEEGVEEGARARQRTGKKGGRSGKKRKSKRVEYQAAPPPSEGTIGGFSPLLLGVPVVALLAGAFWWFRMRGGTVSLPSLGKRPSAGDDDDAPPAIPDRVPDLAAMLAGKSSGPEVLDRKAKKELDKFASQLRSQQTLSLQGKSLGDAGMEYLAPALAFNNACVALDLGNNGIGSKGAAALSEVLRQNKHLESLNMEVNNIGDEGAENLAGLLIAGTSGIKKLRLASNNIGDAGAAALASALKENTVVKSLDLSSNGVEYEGIKALAEALVSNTTLEQLSLSDNYIGVQGALVLANGLRGNKSLKSISIAGNDLGDGGCEVILSALAAREGAELTQLDIGNNGLSSEEGCKALADLLKASANTLQSLVLKGNDLGAKGTEVVFTAMAAAGMPALKELQVETCSIRPEAAKYVAEALGACKALETVNLSSNPLAPMGMKALAEALKFGDCKVKDLRLGWVKLGSVAGAESVADVLQFNATIESLDLRGNDFKNNGALHVARALRAREGAELKELLLEYNSIEDQGLCAIAQALKANPEGAPRTLKVSYNNHTSMSRVALDEARDMVLELTGDDMELWY